MAVIGLQEVPDIYPASKSAQSTSLSFAGAYDDSFLMLSHRNGVSPAPVRSLQHLVFKVADTKAGIERARAAGALIRPEPAQAHGMAWHGKYRRCG